MISPIITRKALYGTCLACGRIRPWWRTKDGTAAVCTGCRTVMKLVEEDEDGSMVCFACGVDFSRSRDLGYCNHGYGCMRAEVEADEDDVY